MRLITVKFFKFLLNKRILKVMNNIDTTPPMPTTNIVSSLTFIFLVLGSFSKGLTCVGPFFLGCLEWPGWLARVGPLRALLLIGLIDFGLFFFLATVIFGVPVRSNVIIQLMLVILNFNSI